MQAKPEPGGGAGSGIFFRGDAGPRRHIGTGREVPVVKAAGKSAYDNVPFPVSNYVNVRSRANTTSAVVGKIYNNCAARSFPLWTGRAESGTRIQSGNVKGYIKLSIL